MTDGDRGCAAGGAGRLPATGPSGRHRMPAASGALRALPALWVAVAALATGCAVPPLVPHQTPQLELPAAAELPDVAADWWKGFGDPRLDALVDEALADNRDLGRAIARIDESRAALRAADAERYPTVGFGASAARQRISESGSIPLVGVSAVGNDFRVGFNVAYEADLWSRVAHASAAARAELLATTLARETLRTALAAQVVQAYATLQSLDGQLRLYGQAVQQQRDSLRLQRLRFDAGDISELDVRQLDAELLENEAQLPKLERARGEAERALSLVLGRSPRALIEQGIDRGAVALPGDANVPDGLPSDLLLRRPDVQAAEARLRAAGARVEAARAAYFPRIALTAALGQESNALSHLFDRGSLVWNVAASLTQPIWDAGRLGAQHDAARARRAQVELDYRDSVVVAFKEVRDALGAQREARATLQTGLQRAQALIRAAELTRLRYDAGESSRLDVINADRLALNAQALNADAQRALLAAQANVFRAFGGGWRGSGVAP